MKKYSIAQKNEPYFRAILEREKIPFTMKQHKNQKDFELFADLTRGKFLTMLEEALGKREQEEKHSSIPIYGHRILNEPETFHKLRKENNKNCFLIDEEELTKFLGYDPE